jgi:hypothetical protein
VALSRVLEARDAGHMAGIVVQQSKAASSMQARAGGSALRAAWPTTVSVLLCVLLLPTIGYGLFSSSAYRGLSGGLVMSSRAQDVLTLLVLPLLLWAAARSRAGSLRGHVAWLGLLFYLAYSYAIYLIGWQQSRVFLVYVLVVLLSAASVLDGLVRVVPSRLRDLGAFVGGRGVGWFLVVVGVAFVGLWLGDLAPSAFGGRAPAQLGVGGTPYPVYVLDLCVALPVVVVSGIMLLRRHPVAQVLAGVVLVKVTTLFVALWAGVAVKLMAGRDMPLTADMVPSALLPVVTALLLVRAARRVRSSPPGWLRATTWSET